MDLCEIAKCFVAGRNAVLPAKEVYATTLQSIFILTVVLLLVLLHGGIACIVVENRSRLLFTPAVLGPCDSFLRFGGV